MITLLTVIHLIVCLFLISLVLLQDPKGGGAGGMFGGGGSNSLFGATGATTFLTRLTRWSAIVFGVTCLGLTIVSKPRGGSVIDASVIPATPTQTSVPAADPSSSTAPAAPSAVETKPAQPAAPEEKKADEPKN